jgi:murein L,D-transpeptidase YafK
VIIRFLAILAAVLVLSGCSSKFKTYNGPEVTHVVVDKGARRMYLLHHEQALKSYDIGLGFNPVGHKQAEGDGRTPEGTYVIDRRNPNSEFHLSLGINYPRDADRRSAKEAGVSPGGDIFIHGRPWKNRKGGRDWTAGCIAVTNREMEEIYAMVRNGTPITINP